MRIFCDFDGTISNVDTIDVLLEQFADPSWHDVESQWEQGLIGSAECMRQQVALLHVNKAALDAALDTIEIDNSFADFAKFCARNALPLSIVSDGVDYFIRRILSKHGLGYLPIFANQLHITGDDTYRLTNPNTAAGCTSGTCKCQIVGNSPSTTLFVGDGRSDFCVSNKPDVVFAKKSLAAYCATNSIAYTPYQTFDDVTRETARLLFETKNIPTFLSFEQQEYAL